LLFPPEHLEPQKIIDLIREFSDIGGEKLCISGGEPLCYEQLPEIIKDLIELVDEAL
jgi:molybdenum cofactor biosynthesis enzyme MoaA